MRESVVRLINVLISLLPLAITIGILHALVAESRTVGGYFWKHDYSRKSLATLMPFGRRLLYVCGGIVLVTISYMITNSFVARIAQGIDEGGPFRALTEESPWWDRLLHPLAVHSSFGGITNVLIIALAGLALTVSAGDRWFVGLAKLLVTIAFLHIVLTLFALIMLGS